MSEEQTRTFTVGERVWFTKSMRMCKVVVDYGDGNYLVKRLDNDLRLYVSWQGLEHEDFHQEK